MMEMLYLDLLVVRLSSKGGTSTSESNKSGHNLSVVLLKRNEDCGIGGTVPLLEHQKAWSYEHGEI